MNSKFLCQVFAEGDFSEDYRRFLGQFEQIMMEDNVKKVKYLAWLLTNEREGKKRSVEMVRRLPWTRAILQKVLKIAHEMLKFSPEGH